MLKKIYFRTDANSKIGSGHVMRCLSIAFEFIRNGNECCFITADHNADIFIDGYGILHKCLDTKWNQLDGEIDKITDYLYNEQVEMIIVDHYYVTENYLEKLRSVCKLVYIDDLNAFTYPVDVIINYNIYAESLDYETVYSSNKTKLLLGTKYVPLREEFNNIKKRIAKKNVEDVFISTGGSDPLGTGVSLLKKIKNNQDFHKINFHFILGALNVHRDEIIELSKNTYNIKIYENVKHMSQIMMKCDIAVSAAGSTLYELCACGVPTITYVIADNQIVAAEYFSMYQMLVYAGDMRKEIDKCIERIFMLIEELCKDHVLRDQKAQKIQSVIDGGGTERIVNALI